jgi:hypothetical protein
MSWIGRGRVRLTTASDRSTASPLSMNAATESGESVIGG